MPAAVAEKIAEGIRALLQSKHPPRLIILDDAFQHRHVQGKLRLLLTTWEAPFFSDYLLPAGNLREARSGYRRADMLVVTKCPAELTNKEKEQFLQRMGVHDRPVFFSAVDYGQPVNAIGEELPPTVNKVGLITGIANAGNLKQKLLGEFELEHHWQYGDHHRYSREEIRPLEETDLPVITTEKDWARLRELVSDELAARLYRWPIRTKILFGQQAEFIKLIKNKLELAN
jgi:tetraacyldisaccharide 4'-kinase